MVRMSRKPSATGRELHDEDRDPEKREAGEIREDEKPATRLARDIRKAPYIPEPYRAPGGQEYEAKAACELFPHFSSRFLASLSSEGARPSALRAFSIALRYIGSRTERHFCSPRQNGTGPRRRRTGGSDLIKLLLLDAAQFQKR